jgi:hypothetical protein
MDKEPASVRPVFPKSVNFFRPVVGTLLAAVPLYIITLVYYGNSAEATRIGYEPEQPVAFSHALHAGRLGIDCRYCHNTVETASHAAIPPTETCMNCHANIRSASAKILPVRESHATGMPIEWVRVHDIPDFVYFDHSAHVRRGIGCVSCHGRVDKMETVRQEKPLTMGWCLDCHRAPEEHLRPPELATKMDWVPNEDPFVLGKRLRDENHVNPSTDCTTCHR